VATGYKELGEMHAELTPRAPGALECSPAGVRGAPAGSGLKEVEPPLVPARVLRVAGTSLRETLIIMNANQPLRAIEPST
jgi:hypothetical protein